MEQIVWFMAIMLSALVAGFEQGITGFGFGIVVMMIYPYLIGITQAACVAQCLAVFLCLAMAVRYRKHIRWKLLLMPLAMYFPIYFAALTCVKGMDMDGLKPALGVFLVLLSVYFIRFSGKVSIRPTPMTALLCSGLSAVIDAAFGIGGPPMVLYFLSVTKEKEEYLGTIQTFFLVGSAYGTCMRALNGMLGPELIPVLGGGFAAMILGMAAAVKVVGYLNTEKIKKIVYVFIGAVGVSTILTSVLL